MEVEPTRNRVFVVEDDSVYRELLTFGLTAHGYEVYVAESGAAAVRLLQNADPDVIVLDLLMPAMDGMRFLHWLRNEVKLEIPVLVVTCLDDRPCIVDALVAGANDVMVKPVDLAVLASKIDSLISTEVL